MILQLPKCQGSLFNVWTYIVVDSNGYYEASLMIVYPDFN